jgi:hypothetical protein
VINRSLATGDAAEIGRLVHAARQAAAYRAERAKAALASLQRLWSDSTHLARELGRYLDEASRHELDRVETVCRQRARALGVDTLPQPLSDNASEWRRRAATLVPRRLYRGPMAFHSAMEEGPPAERDALWEASQKAHRGWPTARTLAEYWIDGKRTVDEIIDLVHQETGSFYGPEILGYCELLASKGLLTWQS